MVSLTAEYTDVLGHFQVEEIQAPSMQEALNDLHGRIGSQYQVMIDGTRGYLTVESGKVSFVGER